MYKKMSLSDFEVTRSKVRSQTIPDKEYHENPMLNIHQTLYTCDIQEVGTVIHFEILRSVVKLHIGKYCHFEMNLVHWYSLRSR